MPLGITANQVLLIHMVAQLTTGSSYAPLDIIVQRAPLLPSDVAKALTIQVRVVKMPLHVACAMVKSTAKALALQFLQEHALVAISVLADAWTSDA